VGREGDLEAMNRQAVQIAREVAREGGALVAGNVAEALGREAPASKYSPSMDLHPMFRADVAAKDAVFLHSWTA
jgi:hypothetical protein